MGEFRQWKQESVEWRGKAETTLKEISEFLDQVRTPRKFIVWSIRIFVIAAIGSIATSVIGFVKAHLSVN